MFGLVIRASTGSTSKRPSRDAVTAGRCWKLLEAALHHPRLAHATRIFLTVWDENEGAVRLYERFGFQTVGTTRFTIGAEDVDDLVMLLDKTR